MKKTNVLQIVLISAILSIAQTTEEKGLKLQGSGACIASCVQHTHEFQPQRIFETEYKLTPKEFACAVNQVGKKCLDRMKEERRKHNSMRATRQGWQMVEEYTEADYIYCRLGGRFRAKVETCIYSHPPIVKHTKKVK